MWLWFSGLCWKRSLFQRSIERTCCLWPPWVWSQTSHLCLLSGRIPACSLSLCVSDLLDDGLHAHHNLGDVVGSDSWLEVDDQNLCGSEYHPHLPLQGQSSLRQLFIYTCVYIKLNPPDPVLTDHHMKRHVNVWNHGIKNWLYGFVSVNTRISSLQRVGRKRPGRR